MTNGCTGFDTLSVNLISANMVSGLAWGIIVVFDVYPFYGENDGALRCFEVCDGDWIIALGVLGQVQGTCVLDE